MEWIEFYERLETVAPDYRTRVWYQPIYARRERMARYSADGYRGCKVPGSCVGRPLFYDQDGPIELDLREHVVLEDGVTLHRHAL